jgi:hypothetical protein
MVWILGRIYSTGTPEDYKAVHALQDKFSVVPLSAYGKPYTQSPGVVDPAFDMHTAVRKQVNALNVDAYFNSHELALVAAVQRRIFLPSVIIPDILSSSR